MWSSKARLGKRKGQSQYSQDIAFWKQKEISHGLNSFNSFNPCLISFCLSMTIVVTSAAVFQHVSSISTRFRLIVSDSCTLALRLHH